MKAGRALLFLLLLVWSATGLSARPFKSLFVFPGYASLGSVRYLTDAAGLITDTFTYDAFGILIDRRVRTSGGVLAAFANPALETPPPGTVPVGNNYRYTGEQWAQDLGMYYLRARYYNPQIGRFWTMDTYEGNRQDPLSLHKYLYCQDNPANHVDPSGHMIGFGMVLTGGLGSLWTRGEWEGARTPSYAGGLRAAWQMVKILGFAYATTQSAQDDKSRFGRILYHYDTMDGFQYTGFLAGIWLTDRGDLPFDEAISMTFQSGSRLFVYEALIKSLDEIEPFPPLRPGVNQWRTTGLIPPLRVKIAKTLYGPNWSGPKD